MCIHIEISGKLWAKQLDQIFFFITLAKVLRGEGWRYGKIDTMRRTLFSLFLCFETIPQVKINCGSGKQQLSSSQNLPELCKKNISGKPDNNRRHSPSWKQRGRVLQLATYSLFISSYQEKYVDNLYFPKERFIHWWQPAFPHLIFSQTWIVFVGFLLY